MALLALVPTPYWILAPGSAVDLNQSVAVEGHAPPVDRFFLTDVSVQRANGLLLLTALLPGEHIVREDALVPRGVPRGLYDRRLAIAMDESQDTAAVVAERAAGFRVADFPPRIVVSSILPASRAARVLHVGDEIVGVDGQRVTGLREVAAAVRSIAPGGRVSMLVRRQGRTMAVRVPTVRFPQGTRIGIELERHTEHAALPVPVRYSLGNVAGSSGGLMLALQIYSALRGHRNHPGTSIAGTGTLAMDGTIGPIEGTQQKLISAKRAGARIFLVPRQNFADVANERDVRVVPVSSFRDALAALPS